MTPDEYCQQKAAHSGSSFYYSFLFLPPERRRAITALYAFCREVDDVVDEVSEATVARAKLAWWRTEIDAAFEGVPEHPVGKALAPVVRDYGLPREQLQTVIDGMAMDLEQVRYVDFPALELYCHRVAGVVGMLSARIFGYSEPATAQYARDLGIAFQAIDVGAQAQHHRNMDPRGAFRNAEFARPLDPHGYGFDRADRRCVRHVRASRGASACPGRAFPAFPGTWCSPRR